MFQQSASTTIVAGLIGLAAFALYCWLCSPADVPYLSDGIEPQGGPVLRRRESPRRSGLRNYVRDQHGWPGSTQN